MKAKGIYPGSTVAELWGGPTDQNAFWFKSGNDAIFNPLFASGKLKKGPQQFVPDWDATNAATIFEQMLVKTNNNIQAVLAANDNIAGAVIADLKAKGLKPVPVSGQDTTAQGVQYILAGWQTGTVFKYVPLETQCGGGGGNCPAARLEADDERLPDERQEEGADRDAPGGVDHEGQLHEALHARLAEEERSLRRQVRAVLLGGHILEQRVRWRRRWDPPPAPFFRVALDRPGS